MTATETASYLELACRLAELAGRAILPHFRRPIEVQNKGSAACFDPVTEADRAAEEIIRQELRRVSPHDAIYGEEHGRIAGESGLTWIIDPIDGTRSFILGQLHWGTLIALNDGTRPVVGIMHQPFVGETFAGSPLGAFWRRSGVETPMRARSCAGLKDAVVCTTAPEVFPKAAERAAFESVAARSRMVRYGGDCYNYCLLAAGLIDVVIESALSPYDIQPVVPMIQSAGGIITDWRGEQAYDGPQVVAAGDPCLHAETLQFLSAAAERK
jgi:histidinol phosphatase-like enzyme (inositol monophosphatase family)